MEIAIGLIIGLAVGAAVALIVHRQASALRNETSGLREELEGVRTQLQERALAQTAADAQLQERTSQLAQRTDELAEQRRQAGRLRDDLGEAREELRQVESDRTARIEELDKKQREIDTLFKSIAADVAKASNEEFRKQAAEDFKRQRELADQELKQHVQPVGKSLDQLRQQIVDLEKARTGAYEGVNKLITETQRQVGLLNSETGDLREILRSSQLRGSWGEKSLENLLQLAGMRKGVDYETQYTPEHGSGRADFVVRMPGGKKIVIDSKTPWVEYRQALSAQTEEEQQTQLALHARSVLDTAAALGKQEYEARIDDALDFVVMWVPSDSILEAATRVRPDLIDEAYQKHRVLLATPVTMIALLNGVASALKQEQFHENALLIQQHAQTIYDGVRRHATVYGRLGRQLGSALDAYNEGVGSIQGNLLRGARRMREMGGGAEGAPVTELDNITAAPRALTAKDFDNPDFS